MRKFTHSGAEHQDISANVITFVDDGCITIPDSTSDRKFSKWRRDICSSVSLNCKPKVSGFQYNKCMV